jgi:hypothetical protein
LINLNNNLSANLAINCKNALYSIRNQFLNQKNQLTLNITLLHLLNLNSSIYDFILTTEGPVGKELLNYITHTRDMIHSTVINLLNDKEKDPYICSYLIKHTIRDIYFKKYWKTIMGALKLSENNQAIIEKMNNIKKIFSNLVSQKASPSTIIQCAKAHTSSIIEEIDLLDKYFSQLARNHTRYKELTMEQQTNIRLSIETKKFKESFINDPLFRYLKNHKITKRNLKQKQINHQ